MGRPTLNEAGVSLSKKGKASGAPAVTAVSRTRTQVSGVRPEGPAARPSPQERRLPGVSTTSPSLLPSVVFVWYFIMATRKVTNTVAVSVEVVFTYNTGGSRERPQD